MLTGFEFVDSSFIYLLLSLSCHSNSKPLYVFQITLWLILWWKPISVLVILSKMFFAGLYVWESFFFLLRGFNYQILLIKTLIMFLPCIYVGVSLFAALGFLLYGGRWLSISIFNCIFCKILSSRRGRALCKSP